MPINVPVDDKDCWQKALNAQKERADGKTRFPFCVQSKSRTSGRWTQDGLKCRQ